MVRKKEILLDAQAVGQAVIEQDGLYCTIRCICKFPDSRIYTIILKQEAEDRPLGICVPERDGFRLETRIPKKYYRAEDASFYAVAKDDKTDGQFIPLICGEPVCCLGVIGQAAFEIREGVPGLRMKHPVSTEK